MSARPLSAIDHSNDGAPEPKRARPASPCGTDIFDSDLDRFAVEEELPLKEAPLSWRMDGTDSMSDWTIVIKRFSDEPATATNVTYHVHKTVLAIGPRSSEYFSTLFRSSCPLSESALLQSAISLADGAADAFPAMLDFMYSAENSKELKVTTNNSIPLRHLSQYFRVRSLLVEVTKFIREDLRPNNAPRYITEAAAYCDEKLVQAACDLCAESLGKVDVAPLMDLCPQLFKKVLYSEKMSCNSKVLSKIVAAFCKEHEGEVSKELLEGLTGFDLMPTIDPEAADQLLKCNTAFEHGGALKVKTDNISLQDRCTDALSENWRKGVAKPLKKASQRAKGEEECAAVNHRGYPNSLQVQILEKSLCCAETEVSARENQLSTKDTEITKLKAEIAAKNRELDILKGDANNFFRVPNKHRFGKYSSGGKIDKTACTYEVNPQKNRGNRPPSRLPSSLDFNQVKEGYVFQDGLRRWPVYYYRGTRNM